MNINPQDIAPQSTDEPDKWQFIGVATHTLNSVTTYKGQETCQLAIELGRKGKSKAYIAAALGMGKSNIDNWIRKFPDFAEAMEISQALSQAWWEDAGQVGMMEKTIDGGIWKHSISSRFPQDWRDTSRIEQTGANGGALQIENKVSVVDQILTNLDAIAKKTSE